MGEGFERIAFGSERGTSFRCAARRLVVEVAARSHQRGATSDAELSTGENTDDFDSRQHQRIALAIGDARAVIMIETDAGTVVETADHGNRSAFNGTPLTTSMRIMYRRCLREFYERPTQTKRKRLQEIKQ